MTMATTIAPCDRAISAAIGNRSGAGAAAHARGEEDHVGALHRFRQLARAFFGGGAPDGGIAAGAQAARGARAERNLAFRQRIAQRLMVGVAGDEFHAADAEFDHPVDGVRTAAAQADHFDHRLGAGEAFAFGSFGQGWI